MYRLWIMLACFAAMLLPSYLAVQAQKAPADVPNKQLEKLEAFAKAFGCVRYFHPSDQASLAKWDQLAYFGTSEVLDSAETESTRELIQRIFAPIVIDLEIYEGAEKPRPKTEKVSANEIFAWQHIGVGIKKGTMYQSERLNGPALGTSVSFAPFANLLQPVAAANLREKEFRLRIKARTEEGQGNLQGWYRIDRNEENSQSIASSEWKTHELSGTVPKNAKRLFFGVKYFGGGSAWVDEIHLEVKEGEAWSPVEIRNPEFNGDEEKPTGWGVRDNGYSVAIVRDDDLETSSVQFSGGSQSRKRSVTKTLFPNIPEKGEVVDIEIAPSLRLRMPLTLPIDSRYEPGTNELTDAFLKEVENFEIQFVEPKVRSLANTVLAWNVFQHFYPYFDQVDCDWDKSLTEALKRGTDSDSRAATTETLQWLVAQLHDGHGRVFDSKAQQEMGIAPVLFGWVEDQLVVVASENPDFKIGDVVTQLDGIAPIDRLIKDEKLISGSPQWKRNRSVQSLSMGKRTVAVSVELKRKTDAGGETIETTLSFENQQPIKLDKGEICRKLEGGDEGEGENIWYIDLGRAEPGDINDKMEKFAAAKGIVLDLRGYPNGTQYLFQHMTDSKLQSQKWMIPLQIRPNRMDMTDFETSGRWQMPPLEPRFKGKMVFITNASAISYAESCMAIVANYKLGEIIGSPTAGANGNVNPFTLPGGYHVSWTGMRVINHDDSQHHVRGVQPTIPMKPTVKGIREGRDELLEKAIELIR